MDDRVDRMLPEHAVEQGAIADVALDEGRELAGDLRDPVDDDG